MFKKINKKLSVIVKQILVDYFVLNHTERKNLKNKYGKEFWRYSKEYYKYRFELTPIKFLVVGIGLFVSGITYRTFHERVFNAKIRHNFIEKGIGVFIELEKILKNSSIIDLIKNWEFFTDLFLILGISTIVISLLITKADKYSPEISLLIHVFKFLLIISFIEFVKLYSLVSVVIAVLLFILSSDLYEILVDIYKWIQNKQDLKYDLKKLSLLLGIIIALLTIITKGWK